MDREIFNDLFIFEMANNHQGDVRHGVRIIEAMGKIARDSGIRAAVKLQYRDLDTFIHPDFVDRDDVKHIPRFLSTRMDDAEFRELVEAIRGQNMLSVCTPFDEASVETSVRHGIEFLKVASCSAKDWPLLETMVRTGKPVIASTGGCDIYDIDNLVSFLGHHGVSFALMHCVGIYPTQNDQVQMNFLAKLCGRYAGVPIGYSGHESPDNLDVVAVAVAMEATLLERHVGVPMDDITLNAYSMSPDQAAAWVDKALACRAVMGVTREKRFYNEELDSLRSLQRGVYAARSMSKNCTISRDDVSFAMPCSNGQVTSGEFGRLRTNYVATRDYAEGDPIVEKPAQMDERQTIRRILHDAKGLLNEANVIVGKDSTVELSHHYGLDRFREVGALIVNVINREYCKKLVIVLPGQKHPNHMHKRKEETFQLLWGDLQVGLDRRDINLSPGDMVLVERETWHRFSSRGGAIFEEVSTTHRIGDSYYEDTAISDLDPMDRKMTIETW